MPNQDEVKHVELARDLPAKQNATAEPVILAPHLPTMEKVGAVKTVLRNTLLPLMGAQPPQSTGGEGTMMPVPEKMPAPSVPTAEPQKPKPGAAPITQGEGYVRMEIHFENGNLSLVGVKEVPGPLAMPSAVVHGYAYEVVLGDQQIALGSLPDVGVRRAFANRDVPGPQGKHYIVSVPAFDFFVRVPQGHISAATLPKLVIALHKVEDAPDRFTSLSPLAGQPGVKTVEVGRLVGIKLEQLPQAVRSHLEQILERSP